MTNKNDKYALISVYNKKGIVKLAEKLIRLGYNIIASEGTGKKLQEANISYLTCQEVSENPECFDGFMKTLSFSIEGGIIYDRENPVHVKEAKELGVKDIGVVVCNFFPIEVVLEKFNGQEPGKILRCFDFGGPIMTRVAAQNFRSVTVLVDPEDYAVMDSLLQKETDERLATNKRLAIKAFKHILNYNKKVVEFLDGK